VRQSPEIAEHQRTLILFRQTGDLLVEGGEQFIPVALRARHRRLVQAGAFAPATAGRGGPRLERDAAADPMEPTSQRIGHPDRGGPLDQDQEGRLKRISGILGIGKHPSTDAQHHRPVSLDQDGKRQLRNLVAPGPVELQELPIAQRSQRSRAEQRPDPAGDLRDIPRHRAGPAAALDSPHHYGQSRRNPSRFSARLLTLPPVSLRSRAIFRAATVLFCRRSRTITRPACLDRRGERLRSRAGSSEKRSAPQHQLSMIDALFFPGPGAAPWW
jgi:hypothetical protein